MTTLTVTLTLPRVLLTQNLRCHWAVRARETSAQRELSGWAAAAQLGLGRFRRAYDQPVFWRGRVRLDATVYPRKGMRRLDDDNFWSAVKPWRDGLADAGLVANDAQFVIGTLTWAKERRGEVLLTLVEVEHGD
jgi:hypothetical protein